jgi:hypothetical protein
LGEAARSTGYGLLGDPRLLQRATREQVIPYGAQIGKQGIWFHRARLLKRYSD